MAKDMGMRTENGDCIVGYRCSATGVFSYDFYLLKEKICTVGGLVVPSPPISVLGAGISWTSEFDYNTKVVRGTTRYVYDNDTKRLECRLINTSLSNGGKLQIYGIAFTFSGNFIEVDVGDEYYAFSEDGKLIARTSIVRKQTDWIPDTQYSDVEPYYEVEWFGGDDQKILMAVLAFPVLKFT